MEDSVIGRILLALGTAVFWYYTLWLILTVSWGALRVYESAALVSTVAIQRLDWATRTFLVEGPLIVHHAVLKL